MFFAFDIEDNIALDCQAAGSTLAETTDQLRAKIKVKFIDKVIANVGLCVWLLDINKVEPRPILSPNDGRPCFKALFQMVVFKPVPREIIHGTIIASDPNGVRVSLGFFQDVRVPAHLLQDPAHYDNDVNLWSWRVEADDGTGQQKLTDLYLEIGTSVQIKVVDVIYSKDEADMAAAAENKAQVVPMLVVAAMNEPGLGAEAWW